VVPVPRVVRKMCFLSDSRIRRALALLDLAPRNLFALRRARPLAKLALVRGFDVDWHLFHRDPDALLRHPSTLELREDTPAYVAHRSGFLLVRHLAPHAGIDHLDAVLCDFLQVAVGHGGAAAFKRSRRSAPRC
jgi:hypothetical protein